MYSEIWRKYKERFPDFPDGKRPRIGAVIQELRISKGIPQYRFAKLTGINLSTLKSIENDHLQATSLENLEKCANVLEVTVDQFILEGRERDPANFFVFKRQPPQPIEGLKQKKRAPLPWHKTVRLDFKDFELIPLTPPLASKKDFFACRIHLLPKRSLQNLNLGASEQVAAFVSEGHDIRVTHGKNETATLTANQGFQLDGSVTHSIINDDEDIPAVIYLVTKFPRFDKLLSRGKRVLQESKSLNIASAVQYLREAKSQRRGRAMPLKFLADLTDSLDDAKIRALLEMKRSSSVVYWDKIEDLISATEISMEEFLAWAHGNELKELEICTARDRAMIDYTNFLGIKIYSTVFPSSDNHFHCGELHIEGRRGIRRPSWSRKDKAMVVTYVEEGEVMIHVGRNRLATLDKGDSVYFDASLGYLFSNPGDVPAKCFLATNPPIQY